MTRQVLPGAGWDLTWKSSDAAGRAFEPNNRDSVAYGCTRNATYTRSDELSSSLKAHVSVVIKDVKKDNIHGLGGPPYIQKEGGLCML